MVINCLWKIPMRTTHPDSGHNLPFLSKESMAAISASLSSKSKTSMLEMILDLVTDLGMTMLPR